jgi:uncharacterized protein YdeI (YjbR/CyaY-like superfamily)
MSDPIYFASEGELWDWYRWHSEGIAEIWVGLHKKASRIPSVTIRQAMDAALCFGWSESKWITVDQRRFCIRFTRRLPHKGWSPATVKRYLELEALGMVQAEGQRAFEARDSIATERAQTELLKGMALTDEFENRLMADAVAWEYWASQNANYRKQAIRWVMRAKKMDTREIRFVELLESCADARRLPEGKA